MQNTPTGVALRKESVDRNREQFKYVVQCRKSLSARRAWIEIYNFAWYVCVTWSLSARRAWIEIVITAMTSQISVVALRKESVDRNFPGTNIILSTTGRSPQGERG